MHAGVMVPHVCLDTTARGRIMESDYSLVGGGRGYVGGWWCGLMLGCGGEILFNDNKKPGMVHALTSPPVLWCMHLFQDIFPRSRSLLSLLSVFLQIFKPSNLKTCWRK